MGFRALFYSIFMNHFSSFPPSLTRVDLGCLLHKTVHWMIALALYCIYVYCLCLCLCLCLFSYMLSCENTGCGGNIGKIYTH
jgi:hypothetical protein